MSYTLKLKKVCEQAKIIGQLELVELLVRDYADADDDLIITHQNVSALRLELLNKFKSIKVIK